MKDLKDFVKIIDGSPIVKGKATFLEALDSILYQAVFEKDENNRRAYLEVIKEVSKAEKTVIVLTGHGLKTTLQPAS